VFDVCVVGSANLDLVTTTPRRPNPGETVLGTSYAEHAGGKGLNQAVAAARAGASVSFVGAIGGDAAGQALRAVMAADGVDTTFLRLVDAPSGRAVIVVDGEAENSIIVVPGANATVTVDALPPARVVLVQLEVPLATVAATLRMARTNGATTVLNPAPAAALPRELLADVDVLIANGTETELLGGPDALLAAGVATVIVTRGAAGADVITPASRRHQSPFAVVAADTTGAGDAFCGVLAAHLARGDDLAVAVRAGAAAGALTATVPGAVPSLPDAAAIAATLASAADRPPAHDTGRSVSGAGGRPPSRPS
jgi:ribokinase